MLTISYDGAPYHGWQVQKNAPSVQKTLQDALCALTQRPMTVTGCSRTDAGVHALEYVCHTEEIPIPNDRLPQALNAHLPPSVAVRSARTVSEQFHARYSCIGKEYLYKIYNSRTRDPFSVGRALFYPEPIDVDALTFVGEELVGKHDFRAFMAQGSKITDTVRTIRHCTLSREGNFVYLTVSADGFLYNMVRILAGTFLSAARGAYKPGDIRAVLESRDRKRAGFTAPPHGLYLNRVFYPEREVFLDKPDKTDYNID